MPIRCLQPRPGLTAGQHPKHHKNSTAKHPFSRQPPMKRTFRAADEYACNAHLFSAALRGCQGFGGQATGRLCRGCAVHTRRGESSGAVPRSTPAWRRSNPGARPLGGRGRRAVVHCVQPLTVCKPPLPGAWLHACCDQGPGRGGIREDVCRGPVRGAARKPFSHAAPLAPAAVAGALRSRP